MPEQGYQPVTQVRHRSGEIWHWLPAGAQGEGSVAACGSRPRNERWVYERDIDLRDVVVATTCPICLAEMRIVLG